MSRVRNGERAKKAGRMNPREGEGKSREREGGESEAPKSKDRKGEEKGIWKQRDNGETAQVKE